MSKHNKAYGKRGASTSIASIQFDKVITESNKRPSASKSAGVVGKWGTTSFTSLRSSQVNGSKAGKVALSPVKCLPTDYGMASLNPSTLSTAVDAFSFESGANNSQISCPVQPKPRKFFKSRATDDSSKTSSVQPASQNPCSDFPINDNFTNSSQYSAPAAGGVGYFSPPYASPTSKSPSKRSRGRPRGSRNTSPRGAAGATYKPSPARGTTRGRRRTKGAARGQNSGGRGKRKRQQWEESESEEVSAGSSEEAEMPPEIAEIPAEEDDHITKELEAGGNGAEDYEEAEEQKPPIKLRIIRRNDTNAFVSKVGNENEIANSFPPVNSDQEDSQVLPTQEYVEEPPPVEQIMQQPPEVESMKNSPEDFSIPVCSTEAFQPKIPAEVEPMPIEQIENVDIVVPIPQQQYQKKSTIFKSRSNAAQPALDKITISKEAAKGKKGLALYRHKWNEDDGRKGASARPTDGSEGALTAPTTDISSNSQQPSHSSSWDDCGEEPDGPPPKLARLNSASASSKAEADEDGGSGDNNSGSFRVTRKVKDYYTVVRNVKKAHQIQESGEFQEFNDDVDYILDALQGRNPTATRCLSAMSLASKCMEPAFRMHLRAHSTVAKFFQALKDAPSKPSVALCTSCIMFVLTQDRLNMDLDRDSLELMLNLLEIDAGLVDSLDGKELEKNKLKVREICEEMVRKGHAPHLQLDGITAAQLAMETLLSLTSKKAGEWFKEELRVLGGLDHIIQTVTVCTAALTPSSIDHASDWQWDKNRLVILKKVDRCLRVLENVTFQNEENQIYLMEFSDGVLVDATLDLLQVLSKEVVAYSPPISKDSLGHLLSETLSNLMKVVMNLTHDSNDDSVGSEIYGKRPLTWESTFLCLLRTSQCMPEDKRFDVMTLALGILINLVERSSVNQDRLMAAAVLSSSDDIFDAKPLAVRALIDLFVSKEESARLEEARTDEILDGKPPGQSDPVTSQAPSSGNEASSANTGKNQEDAMEETVKKLLHKAGRHMEDSMVAAYVALLLGYVVMKNEDYERRIREFLPEKKFALMVVVLKKFYEFLKLTANAVTSTRGLKNTQMVIKFMEASDRTHSAGNIKVKEEARFSHSDDDM